MKNEHGERLDRNGYAVSIVQETDGECYQCGETGKVERHEIFGGPMRDKSKAQGLWVNLCHICHRTGDKAVHQCAEADRALKMPGSNRYTYTIFAEKYREYINNGGKPNTDHLEA